MVKSFGKGVFAQHGKNGDREAITASHENVNGRD